MLGLDVNTLAVADYEIIARIERIITAFNASGILPVQMQHVNRVATPQGTSSPNYEFISSQYDSSSSLENRPSSPNKKHHHHHHHQHVITRERSISPHHNHHHHVHNSNNRHRSKSPRKNVTIDPNSY